MLNTIFYKNERVASGLRLLYISMLTNRVIVKNVVQNLDQIEVTHFITCTIDAINKFDYSPHGIYQIGTCYTNPND